MVSRKSEKMLCPKAKRHLCIGIVRANDVKYDEKRDEDIGGIGKLKAAICERKRQDRKHEQYVLQEPCLSIEWMNRGEHPENSAKCEQARNEFVLSAQNFPRRDQSQTLIEVKPCHARKLKISAESRQRGLSRICLASYCRRHRFQSDSRATKFGTSPLGVSSHTRLCDSGFRAGRRLDYMDFVLSHIRCSDSY